MKDLNHQLRTLCRRNRDGSFGTQDGRRHMLDQMATQLHKLGYRRMRATLLKPKHVSWTKGGRPRTIPIINGYQHVLLREAKALAKGGSLIPAHLNYAQQQRRYDRQIRKAGMRKLHGLRHAYAQRRYWQLTGWNCPATGGPASGSLSPEQRAIDEEARLTISHELGHSRAAITAVYIGK